MQKRDQDVIRQTCPEAQVESSQYQHIANFVVGPSRSIQPDDDSSDPKHDHKERHQVKGDGHTQEAPAAEPDVRDEYGQDAAFPVDARDGGQLLQQGNVTQGSIVAEPRPRTAGSMDMVIPVSSDRESCRKSGTTASHNRGNLRIARASAARYPETDPGKHDYRWNCGQERCHGHQSYAKCAAQGDQPTP